MIKVISTYGRLKHTDLLNRSLSVYKGLNENKSFTVLQTQVTDLKNVLDSYATTITGALSGTKEIIAQRDAYKTVVVSALSDIALVVNSIARGNEQLLATTGLRLTKTPEPSKLTMPAITSVKPMATLGSMEIKVKPVKGAMGYSFQNTLVANAADTDWQSVTVKTSKCVLTGLNEGSKYWFRVVALGNKGQQICSEIIARYVPQYVIEPTV